MNPNLTCFNGSGCEHSYGAFHIPLIYYTTYRNKKNNAFLAVMDISKHKVVWAWYHDRNQSSKRGLVGRHNHTNILRDRRGSYFLVNGNKVRI